jgi:hypothetical protein
MNIEIEKYSEEYLNITTKRIFHKLFRKLKNIGKRYYYILKKYEEEDDKKTFQEIKIIFYIYLNAIKQEIYNELNYYVKIKKIKIDIYFINQLMNYKYEYHRDCKFLRYININYINTENFNFFKEIEKHFIECNKGNFQKIEKLKENYIYLMYILTYI